MQFSMDSKCEYMQDHARELFASYQMNYFAAFSLISLSLASGNIFANISSNNVAPQAPAFGVGDFFYRAPRHAQSRCK
jgi:hypothetical protein